MTAPERPAHLPSISVRFERYKKRDPKGMTTGVRARVVDEVGRDIGILGSDFRLSDDERNRQTRGDLVALIVREHREMWRRIGEELGSLYTEHSHADWYFHENKSE